MREVAGHLKNLSGASVSAGEAMVGVGTALTAVGIGAGMALAGAVEKASSFDSMLTTIQNNTTMTDGDVRQMHDTILKLGADTGQSFEKLGEGFMHVDNITGDAAKSVEILRVATDSAMAANGNVAQVAQVLGNAMHEYGYDVEDAAGKWKGFNTVGDAASHVMGVMHLAAAESNMTLEQFSESGGKVFAWASALGVPLEDAAANFATLTKHGFDTAQASTQVADMMEHLIKPSKEATKELQRLSKATGVDLVTDFTAGGVHAKGLVGVVNDLHEAFTAAGMSTADQTAEIMKLIPNIRGGMAAFVDLGTGAEDYRHILGDLTNQELVNGITEEAAARTHETLANTMQRLHQTVEAAAITVGEAFLPVVAQLAEKALPVVQTVAQWIEQNPQLTAGILASVAVGGTLVGVLVAIAGALVLLDVVGLPVIAVVLGITAAIAAGIFIWQNWGAITSWLGEHVPAVWNAIKSHLFDAMDAIHTKVTEGWNAIKSHVFDAMEGLHEAITAGWNAVVSTVFDAMEAAHEAITSSWNAIKQTVSDAGEAIKSAVFNAMDWIHQRITDVWNAIPEDIRADLGKIGAELERRFGLFLAAVADWLSRTWEAISTTWTEIVTAVGQRLGEMGEAIGGTFSAIGATVRTHLDATGAFIGGAFSAFGTLIRGALDVTGAFIGQKMSDFGTMIHGWLTDAEAAISATWASIVTTVGTKLGEIGAAIAAKAREFLDEAEKIGQAIIDGIVKGIEGGVKAIGDAAAHVARGALGAAKEALGIASPSKVFQQIGADVVAGLVQGIDSASDDAKDAANRLASATALAMEQGVGELKGELTGIAPAVTQALSTIGGEGTARFDAMLGTMRQLAPAVADLNAQQQALNQTNADLLVTNEQLADVQANINRVELEKQQALQSIQGPLLEFKRQELELDQQIAPLKRQAQTLEQQITAAKRPNVDLERELARLAADALPYKDQLADVEQRLGEAKRANLSLERDLYRAALDLLPKKQELADLERQIGAVGDRGLGLTRSKATLELQLQELPLKNNLADAEEALKTAQDHVAQLKDTGAGKAALADAEDQVKALDDQKRSLEEALRPLERQIELIRRQEEATRLKDELTKNGLEQQKLAIQAAMQATEDWTVKLDQQKALEGARQQFAVAGLELEKQGIQDQLTPLEAKIASIHRAQEAAKVQAEVAVLGLQAERDSRLAAIGALEDQKTSIEQASKSLQDQKALETLKFEVEKAGYEGQKVDLEVHKAALDATKHAQETALASAVKGFQDALTASGAFTSQEATDLSKRLGFWNSEIEKLGHLADAYKAVSAAAAASTSGTTTSGSGSGDTAGSDVDARNAYYWSKYNYYKNSGLSDDVADAKANEDARKKYGFAKGGIAFGPVLGMIGEDPSTAPEVVAPLSELPGLLGLSGRGGGGDTTIFDLRGSQFLNDRAIDELLDKMSRKLTLHATAGGLVVHR